MRGIRVTLKDVDVEVLRRVGGGRSAELAGEAREKRHVRGGWGARGREAVGRCQGRDLWVFESGVLVRRMR